MLSDTVNVAWPCASVVSEPVDAGAMVELPLPWLSVITFPATGWGADPWSFSVTVTVVLPPVATALLPATMDEFVGVTTG